MRSVNFNTLVKEARTSTNKDAKQTTERNLLDVEVAFDSCKESLAPVYLNDVPIQTSPGCPLSQLPADNDKRENGHEINNVAWESYNNLTDGTLSKVMNLQIINERKEPVVLQSPLRKALSPININGNQKHHEASPLTETPFSATCSTKKRLQKNRTPLEKFSAQSSTLKVHEYQTVNPST
ncbi:hypothetical protein TSUD_28420 [Trifolium subterraneum]|uniref:Uncharacterized protein n=1 Tax=Trifolium subterraneum TaxID=3900 RepID=A0A2Z6PBW3_TRISU|nr:hypothetical protein TSUD_28420 [Trifolium subterraneum]